MASLKFLLICSLLQFTCSIIDLDFRLLSDNPNDVGLLCINDNGFPDSNARFKFHNSLGMTFKSSQIDTGTDYLTYNLTEAVILCMIGDESSTPVVFAGE